MFFPLGSLAIVTPYVAIEDDNVEDDNEDEYFANSNHNGSTNGQIGEYDGINSISNGPVASNTATSILVVCSNRERLIVAVLTLKTLFLYSANPPTLIVAYSRTRKSLIEKGYNERLIWKPDSSSIAITTSKDYLLFYKVEWDGNSQVYEMRESQQPVYKRNSLELIVQQRVPRARLSPSAVVRLASKASSMVSLKEELIVGLCNGWLHRLLWNGHVMEDFSVSVWKIPFFYELESKPEYLSGQNATPTAGHVGLIHFVDLVYSPLIGGFGFVLSNGRAGLLIAQSPRYHPSELKAIWAPSLTDAACCAANHKYRLLAFGCKSANICAYNVDETSGTLVQSYHVGLTTIDNPVISTQLGTVAHLEWSPYGTTLGVTWANRGIAGFSVFGSQLWFHDAQCTPCFDWGTEGYQVWLAGDQLRLWQCIRPPSINNSAMGHNKRLTLVGADSLYLSPLRSFEAKVYAPMQSYWQRVAVPWNYIGQWWPIRYCALDEHQECLAVAGSRGLVHCQLQSQKWRLFGNETQEREMTVTGGLCFWKEFVVVACYDIEKQLDEVRFYPRWHQLDNSYCSRVPVDAQILFFNIRNNVFLTFDVDSKCILYSMKLENQRNAETAFPRIRLERCAEILVNDLVPHPACVISAQLLARGGDDAAAKFCDDVDAILLNIAGRLIMLSPQSYERRPTSTSSAATAVLTGHDGPVQNQLEPPLLVASFVEEVWMDLQWQQSADGAAIINGDKPHLSQALWIQCGSRGMRVWMPLFPKSGQRFPVHQPFQQQFISKRIMLPFELSSMYSLAVSSSECLVLGIEACFANNAATVHRKNEVFLHHILRQLLKRNLGLYALEIAGTCRNLKYFPHVLELLLHSVLEEEATSSEPIPDPLLPRVVAFLQEFPEFLQTVAHCARKTEMALWKHLFQTVGSPKDLFEVCIREKQLETAASYFIILQNMESTFSCKHHATMLLNAAVENGKTAIANEVVRFLKALDPEDLESPPMTPLVFNKQSPFPRLSKVTPSSVEDADALVYQQPHPIGRQRHSSIGNLPTTADAAGDAPVYQAPQPITKLQRHSSISRKVSANESLSGDGLMTSRGNHSPNDAITASNGILEKSTNRIIKAGRHASLENLAPNGFAGRNGGISEDDEDDDHHLVSALTPTSSESGTNCTLM